MNRKQLSLFLGLLLLTAAAFTGCGSESYDTSKDVAFLWTQHPSPYSAEAAEAAAADAKGLISSNHKDFQLKIYYVDRMTTADYDAIVEEMTEKLAKKPRDPRTMLLAGLATGGRNSLADSLRIAVELAPEDPYILTYTSQALLRSRPADPERALTLAEKAVEIAPQYFEAQIAHAKALLEAGKTAEAIEAADLALALAPWSYDAARTKVFALETEDRGDEALGIIEEFAQVQPTNPYVLYDLERRYEERGTLEKLVDLRIRAAEMNPQDGWAWLDVADLYERTGQYDKMVDAYEKALADDFYDLDLIQSQMSDEAAKALARSSQWKQLKKDMLNRRAETAEERKQEALAEKLDVLAPEVIARTFDGKEVKLSDFRGEVVVLDFWATWCGPCRLTIPRLADLNNANTGANLVSLNVWERIPDEQRPDYVGKFAAEEGMSWNVWLAANESASDYEVRGIPTFVVIDRDGVIRYKLVGYVPFLDEILGWMIEDAGSDMGVAEAK